MAKRKLLYADESPGDPKRDFIIDLVLTYPKHHRTILRIIRGEFKSRNISEHINETRFTLFCFLDNIKWLWQYRGKISKILDAIENYLLNVQTNAAHTAFMAGDLLGNHWHPSVGIPILLKVLRNGKYVAGRVSAVDGLVQAVRRMNRKYAILPNSKARLHAEIIEQLKLSAKCDRSEKLRRWCEYALRDIQKSENKNHASNP